MDAIRALLSRPDLARLAKRLDAQPARTVEEPGVRRAAVALILRENAAKELELLFVRRAEYEGDPWSGQIAFPGGREEVGDLTLADTAIRETQEETGLDLRSSGRILGRLDDLRPRTVRLPAIIVRPFVVAADCHEACTLAAEIADAFWVPLSSLRDPSAIREAPVVAGGTRLRVMAYHYEQHVIWGMTERILASFLAHYEATFAQPESDEA